MDLSEYVREAAVGPLKEYIDNIKKMVEGKKVKIEEVEGMSEVKAVMAKNGEWERKLELMKENMEGMLAELVVVEEEVESLLREVHKPPSLVDLAAGRVVEEGLGVGEIPTTLRVKVEGLMEERRERARKALGHFVRIRIHFNTVVRDASEAVLVIVGELVQLPELA